MIISDNHIPLTAANTVLYSDYTVLYCAGKSSNDIEHQLNNELQKVSDWLDQKNLFINLETGKTEFFFIWTASKVIQTAKRGDQDPQSNYPRDKVIQVPWYRSG